MNVKKTETKMNWIVQRKKERRQQRHHFTIMFYRSLIHLVCLLVLQLAKKKTAEHLRTRLT